VRLAAKRHLSRWNPNGDRQEPIQILRILDLQLGMLREDLPAGHAGNRPESYLTLIVSWKDVRRHCLRGELPSSDRYGLILPLGLLH